MSCHCFPPLRPLPPSYLSCSSRWNSTRSYHVSCSANMVDCRGTLLFVRGSDSLDPGSSTLLRCLLYCMITSPSVHHHMFSSSLFVPGGSTRLFRLRSSIKASLPVHLMLSTTSKRRLFALPSSLFMFGGFARRFSDLLSVRLSDLLHCQ